MAIGQERTVGQTGQLQKMPPKRTEEALANLTRPTVKQMTSWKVARGLHELIGAADSGSA
ncbi:putative atp-dependent rna helicase dbp-3 protein [Sesbania bispinosa]|nr:putative atp-dependent rna helicase dbp-3 protein [Sesbania bispinosa]